MDIKKDFKTGILTFEQWQGKKGLGSSRIRGHWTVRHWKEAGPELGDCELFKFGQKYDAVIFQKAYFAQFASKFQGIKILDICDPDWLHWSYQFKETLDFCDAVTCSSVELCKSIQKFTDKPVYFVPDRVDLEAMPKPKVHTGPTKTIVWYGYSHNFPILDSCMKAISDLKMDLIVVSDGVYAAPQAFKVDVTNLPFSEQHHLTDIQKGDVVLNPKFNKGKWRFKSDNKTYIARALGMPVAHTEEELKSLLTEEQRIKESLKGLEAAKKEYDIRLSVVDYKEVISDIIKNKHE